jgi:hypothetical protein
MSNLDNFYKENAKDLLHLVGWNLSDYEQQCIDYVDASRQCGIIMNVDLLYEAVIKQLRNSNEKI